jgi:thioester reductase-like protein
MSQEGVAQGSQAPQLSEEEKEKAVDGAMIGITLAQLGILEIELMLAGCLSHPDAFTLDSWHRWANEALDHDDLDKALHYAEKITKFLEERQKLCEELRKKSRKHNKRYSRHSSRH